MENNSTSVLDILDKLLGKGVVVKGDIVLSVADVDLVYLNLELLLSSITTLQANLQKQKKIKQENSELSFSVGEAAPLQSPQPENMQENTISPITNQPKKQEINMDEKNVEKGLSKLVLALVNLLKALMERQAVRKMELGQLTEEQTEKLGKTFLLLDKRIHRLKETFNLQDEDLNLNLGPLGRLV